MRRFRLAAIGGVILSGMVLAGSSVTATGTPPATSAKEGAIFQRQLIMEQIDKDGELIGNILAGIEPDSKLAETTRAFANGARDSVESFRTILPGGRAKPEVWSNHSDFMQRMEAFARNAEAMAKAGEAGDKAAVTALTVNAMPCKQCHDLYRAPKRP